MQTMLKEFLKKKRLENLSEKSLQSYKSILGIFVTEVNCKSSALTIEQVNAFFENALTRKVSKATYATYCRNVKTFLKFGLENGFTTVDYTQIIVPKAPRRVVRLLSDDDIFTIFRTPTANDPVINVRNLCILALMLDSGLRQEEVCNLDIFDVYINECYAIVRGKGSKERYVYLGLTTCRFLQVYLGFRKNLNACTNAFFLTVHGERMTENAVRLFVTRHSKVTGIDFSSHKLRHNFATNYCIDNYMEKGNVDIYKLMHLMGHTNVKTTEIYLHCALDIYTAKEHDSHLDKM